MGAEQNYFTEHGQSGQTVDSVLGELGANRARNGFGFYTSAAPYDAAISWEQRAYEASGGAALVSDFAYDQTSQLVDKMMREAGRTFFHQSDEYGIGLLAPSGTAGLNMVYDAALGEYYRTRGHDYYRRGHNGVAPVILAPINSHEYTGRLARTSGLGADGCVYFDLNEDYQPDLDSMAQAIDSVHKSGREIAFVHAMGGDTQHGLAQNIRGMSNVLTGLRDKPFFAVDTVPHGFSMWAQGRNSEIDFSNGAVDAIVVNPQKTGFNLGSTLAFLRDGRVLGPVAGIDTAGISAQEYAEKKLRLAAVGRELITINGAPALAFFATLQEKGLDWFRQERMRVMAEAQKVRAFIDGHSRFSLLPCDNSTISLVVDGDPDATWRLAQRVNNSCRPGTFVTYSGDLRVRSADQLAVAQDQFAAKRWTDFDGIWMNISHGHTSKHVDDMLVFLNEQVAMV